MSKLTASGLGRAEQCIASTVLPQTRNVGDRYATRGTVFHAFLADVNAHGREKALELAPAQWREQLALVELDGLPVDPAAYAAEVAFAYCSATDTARELGRGLSREEAYALARPEEDIVGTCDVVGLTETSVVLPDYKSGWTDYGPLEDFLQLLAYAVMAARAYGKDEAEIGLIRIREDGSSYWQKATLDAFALDEAAARLRGLSERVAAARALGTSSAVVEGEHCKHCSAFAYCPAKARLVGMAAQVEDLAEPLTAESAAAAWERIDLVRKLFDRVEKVLKEYASESPFTLSDGKIVGPIDHPIPEIDAEKAEPLLESRYGLVFRMEAVEVTKKVSKASIDQAVRSVLMASDPRLKLGKTNEAIWDELVAAGAARTRITNPVRPHKAGKTSKRLLPPPDPEGLPHPAEQVEAVTG